jgi:DNA-binding Lrp family transcriptional regulator
MDELLKLLKQNAKLSAEELAAMLDIPQEKIAAQIKEYEDCGIIRGYQTVINEDKLKIERVRAAIEVKMKPERGGGYDNTAERIGKFPEVDSIFLMSGGYDLLVFVKGSSLQEVAGFVNERLATLDGVTSTSTHFTLKTYKDKGVLMQTEEKHERLKVSP